MRMLSPTRQDSLNLLLLRSLACGAVLTLALLLILLFYQSWPAINSFGWSFITSEIWNPVGDEYGGLAFVYGTLITSFFALLLAAPLSIMTALFLNEVLPRPIGRLLGIFVEMLAAIPSIVFGLWGIFYLSPWVQTDLTPLLQSLFGATPFFPSDGVSFGIGYLTASLILAIMITPTITGLCREIFHAIDNLQKEAAFALGATPFEAMKIAILRPSFPGIIGSCILGLGRALGETMAVAMVIGNTPQIKLSLLEPGATMASVIANEYAESEGDMHISALCLVGLLLFVITFLVNLGARSLVWNYRNKKGGSLV